MSKQIQVGEWTVSYKMPTCGQMWNFQDSLSGQEESMSDRDYYSKMRELFSLTFTSSNGAVVMSFDEVPIDVARAVNKTIWVLVNPTSGNGESTDEI